MRGNAFRSSGPELPCRKKRSRVLHSSHTDCGTFSSYFRTRPPQSVQDAPGRFSPSSPSDPLRSQSGALRQPVRDNRESSVHPSRFYLLEKSLADLRRDRRLQTRRQSAGFQRSAETVRVSAQIRAPSVYPACRIKRDGSVGFPDDADQLTLRPDRPTAQTGPLRCLLPCQCLIRLHSWPPRPRSTRRSRRSRRYRDHRSRRTRAPGFPT